MAGAIDEEHHVGDAHQQHRRGQHGAAELVPHRVSLPPGAREHGHEGSRQTGVDEHVEGQLGDDQRGVVDIQLAAGTEGPGQHPVAQQTHQVAAHGEHREEQCAPWDVGGQEAACHRHHAAGASRQLVGGHAYAGLSRQRHARDARDQVICCMRRT